MTKAAVITSTRAEFGILKPLIQALKSHPSFQADLIVTASHLHEDSGKTENEILEAGLTIDHRIKVFDSVPKTNTDMGAVAAKSLDAFNSHFSKYTYDFIVLLGDRFEILSIAQAAFFQKIPVVHLHGGELTLGSMDDSIRHAITKLSSLHFTSSKIYKARVEQLGEQPSSVFACGAPGLDSSNSDSLLNKKELEEALTIDLSKTTALCTFHPVTNLADNGLESLNNFLQGLLKSNVESILFTMPNIDPGNLEMRTVILAAKEKYPDRIKTFESLGHQKYTSLIKHTNLVAGNSSSGLLEAPFFAKPVVNIGSRQEGRVFDKNHVLNVEDNVDKISEALNIQLALDLSNKLIPSLVYGDGTATGKILASLLKADFTKLTPKRFYDQK